MGYFDAFKEKNRPDPSEPPLNWQQAIIDKYPNIGVAGTAENAAFVAEFKRRGTPETAMQIADELAAFQWPPPAT
jgi:hypothetical protein